MKRAWSGVLFVVAVAVAGCGGSPAPAADGGARGPSDHPPLPSVVPHGGAALSAMQIWTVVWSGDGAVGGSIDDLHRAIFADPYWPSVSAEYGVHGGNARGVIVLPDAPPATLDAAATEQLVPRAAAAGKIAVDDQTVFAFVTPSVTQVTAGALRGCVDFAGLHDETRAGVVYQLVLQCSNGPSITVAASHETVECATDPHPETAPGFFSDQIRFGEVADLCSGLTTTIAAAGGSGLLVTRSWSQVAAATGDSDPCAPAPPGVYFNAAASPLVVTVARGASSGAQLEPFAFGSVGTIRWRALAPTGITFLPASGVNNAGDVVALTVAAAAGMATGDFPFRIEAASNSGGSNVWNGQVTVR